MPEYDEYDRMYDKWDYIDDCTCTYCKPGELSLYDLPFNDESTNDEVKKMKTMNITLFQGNVTNKDGNKVFVTVNQQKTEVAYQLAEFLRGYLLSSLQPLYAVENNDTFVPDGSTPALRYEILPLSVTVEVEVPAAVNEVPENLVEGSLYITSFGKNKINVIGVVREMTTLGLKDAKDLVEATALGPQRIPNDTNLYGIFIRLRDAGVPTKDIKLCANGQLVTY